MYGSHWGEPMGIGEKWGIPLSFLVIPHKNFPHFSPFFPIFPHGLPPSHCNQDYRFQKFSPAAGILYYFLKIKPMRSLLCQSTVMINIEIHLIQNILKLELSRHAVFPI